MSIDWRFLHNWVHERAIRDTFLKITDFLANPIDKLVIDGAVNGTGRLVARASGGLRKMQTGYVRQLRPGDAGRRGAGAGVVRVDRPARSLTNKSNLLR